VTLTFLITALVIVATPGTDLGVGALGLVTAAAALAKGRRSA